MGSGMRTWDERRAREVCVESRDVERGLLCCEIDGLDIVVDNCGDEWFLGSGAGGSTCVVRLGGKFWLRGSVTDRSCESAPLGIAEWLLVSDNVGVTCCVDPRSKKWLLYSDAGGLIADIDLSAVYRLSDSGNIGSGTRHDLDDERSSRGSDLGRTGDEAVCWVEAWFVSSVRECIVYVVDRSGLAGCAGLLWRSCAGTESGSSSLSLQKQNESSTFERGRCKLGVDWTLSC